MGKEREQQKLKGIKALHVSIAMLVVACGLFAVTCMGVGRVYGRYQQLTEQVDVYLRSEGEIRRLEEMSDYLTEQARRFAMTRNRHYMDAYFDKLDESQELDRVIEDIMESQGADSGITAEYLRTALRRSVQLTECELHSMKLVCVAKGYGDLPERIEELELPAWELWVDDTQKLERAYSLVSNQVYNNVKSRTDSRFAKALEYISADARESEQKSEAVLRNSLREEWACVLLLFVTIVLIFAFIYILMLLPIREFIKRIKEDKPLDIIGSYELRYLAVTYNKMYEVNTASKAILQHQAEHDALTGLLNRQALVQLKQYLGTIKKPLALILVDLDYFKNVNDDYGHAVGDQVLKKLAGLLVEYFRSNDYPIRLGGDEFAVFMLDVTEAEKDIIAQKADLLNQTLLHPDDGLPKISASIGVAFSKEGYQSELYEHADSALYRTKENGRCGYSFYEEERAEDI